ITVPENWLTSFSKLSLVSWTTLSLAMIFSFFFFLKRFHSANHAFLERSPDAGMACETQKTFMKFRRRHTVLRQNGLLNLICLVGILGRRFGGQLKFRVQIYKLGIWGILSPLAGQKKAH